MIGRFRDDQADPIRLRSRHSLTKWWLLTLGHLLTSVCPRSLQQGPLQRCVSKPLPLRRVDSAHLISSATRLVPILSMTCARCTSIVRTLIPSCSAISLPRKSRRGRPTHHSGNGGTTTKTTAATNASKTRTLNFRPSLHRKRPSPTRIKIAIGANQAMMNTSK